jgi:hypothetical protein
MGTDLLGTGKSRKNEIFATVGRTGALTKHARECNYNVDAICERLGYTCLIICTPNDLLDS